MQLNNQQQRNLALGILIAVLILLYLLVVSPTVSQYQQANDQIDSLTFQLQRYQRLNDSRPHEENLLLQVKQDSPLKAYFLEGETRSVVSAKLQQHLKQLVAGSGGQIVSTQGLPSSSNKEQLLRSITLKVHFKAGIDQLKELLFALETSKPGLYIENLSISSTPIRNSSYARRQVLPPLDIRFNLTGYSTGRDSL
ncbi:type II secretion system protein GspM [Amphritea japonica]|uniref:General secretion pathway protein M n=1 Tax=Amphritea japonica ATCC BAA-1530 TaxID=1278309 RepID=A0A7R6PNV4_9GAMM|nr:type II secretion system protein GspM [Amphritea japonica]BBB26773.1 general secretion pathway protein M [Amphritea japonica ATCC BAA-1530]